MINVWLFMGPPGCGKGTQANLVKSKFKDTVHLSTGDLLRAEIKSNSDFGLRVKSYVEQGKLVPDDLILDIFSRAVSSYNNISSVILDGFPRTLPQAKSLAAQCLDSSLNLSGALWFNISSDVIVKRASTRRVCINCGEIYNIITKRPSVDGVCDKCSGSVVHRKDDMESIILDRLTTYAHDTEPLRNFYSSANQLFDIDAEKDSVFVHDQILTILKKM